MMRLLPAVCLVMGGAMSAVAEDWPHWRGPNRNGVTAEPSGFDGGAWPGEPAWSVNVGIGSTSPLVVGDRVYVMGWREGKDHLQCLDAATGRTLWSVSYDSPKYARHAVGDQDFYAGPSSTPEFDKETGLIYTLSVDGELRGWDTRKDGELTWRLNLYDKYNVPQRPQITKRPGTRRDYGYTTAPLVLGDVLIVEVGAPEHGCLIAYDKLSGDERWRYLDRAPAGHTGGLVPIVIPAYPWKKGGGVYRCVVALTARSQVIVHTEGERAGRLYSGVLWETDFANNIATPTVHGDRVIISSKYNKMSTRCARYDRSVPEAQKGWEIKTATGVCSPVVHDGHVYFANRGLARIDLETGELKWHEGNFGDAASCIVTGDGRIIVWANGGDLSLVEDPAKVGGQFKLLAEKRGVLNSMAWPHIALANGRLLCKDRDGGLVCFVLNPGKK